VLCGANLAGRCINIIFKVAALFNIVNMFVKFICNSQGHSEYKYANNACGNCVFYDVDYISVTLFILRATQNYRPDGLVLKTHLHRRNIVGNKSYEC
jgi:hypothetical protein